MTTKADIDAMKYALAQRANKGVAHMEGGGQARTRAGTIAKPTFIDEQLGRTSERLSKLFTNPEQAIRDIAAQYFPSSADSPEEQQRKLEELALGFTGNIKPVGGVSAKAAKEVATISNMQQTGELPLSASEMKRASPKVSFEDRGRKALSAASPVIDRDANLQKFLAPSAEKRKMYHGSKKDITEFKTRKNLTDESNMTGHYADERDAVFLSPEPEFTNNFSVLGYTALDEAPTTYPVYVQAKKPFDFDNSEHLGQVKKAYFNLYHDPKSDFYNPNLLDSERSLDLYTFNKRVDGLSENENNWPIIENEKFQLALKNLGFDSFYTRERGTKNLGVYDPSTIKSATGNRGTYDVNEPDITKADGGLIHMDGGGQARTRAGTIAKPTFIDEQLAKTSERLSKLYSDPDQALRDIARQYFPSSTDTPAQQQQKLEDLALGFAGSIKTPKAPKSPSSTGGEYLPGVHYADPLQAPTMRMSEALGNVGAEGKTLRFTEADRSRVFGPNRGGVGFSALQHYSVPHKEARTVWGYGNESTARKKINQNDPNSTIWTTYAGSPTQHKSNTVVIKDAIKTLQDANKAGEVHPEQINLINYRLQQAVNDKGKPLFPEGFDITDPKALSHATTFDRRAIISDALMGVGVKKPMRSVEFKEANPNVAWSDASNIESILARETDPALVNANTFDVGPHLFTIENQVIHRPDLNEAFPYQVTGEDLGMRFQPAPFRLAAPEFTKDIPADEAINAWKMSRGNPSQFVSEDYLSNLQKYGLKDGGAVHMAAGGSPDPYQDDEDMSQDEKKFALLKEQQKKAVIKPMPASSQSLNELRQSLGLPDQDVEYRDTGLGGALQLSTYAKERAKEMFPKQYGIDDQRDAARHMIASGTLARKFNPSVAKFIGKGYEFLSSPATSIGYGLGLNEMPPDYAMDIYNNELGIELARKAKTQEEFERLVNMSATGALPNKSPGRAMIIPTKKK
jgi:hypothetical protein